jgi:hypothetical protein
VDGEETLGLLAAGLVGGAGELGRAEDEGEAHLDEGCEQEDQEVGEEDAQLVAVAVACFL